MLKLKPHYCFVVAAGCFLVMFYGMGMTFNLASLFMSRMVLERGLSQSQVSDAMTLQSIVSLLCIFFLGRIYNRYSTRRILGICSLAGVFAYCVFAFDGIFMCYLGAIFVGIAHGGAALVPVSILVTNWFERYRGTVISFCMIGSSGANIVCSKIVSKMFLLWGLTVASLVHAASILLLCVVSLLLIRNEPADKGLLAYGAGEIGQTTSGNVQNAAQKADTGSGWTVVIVAIAMFMVGFVITPLNGFYPTFLQSVGYQTEFLGTASLIFGTTMLISKLFIGVLIDKLGIRAASVILYALPLAAVISALMVTAQPLTATVFVMLWGAGNPIGTVPLPLWVQNIFGQNNYKLTYSRMLAAFTLGSTVGFFLIGKMADRLGSYRPFFAIDTFFLAVSFALLMCKIGNSKRRPDNG